jgi:rod shape determining protein RodA
MTIETRLRKNLDIPLLLLTYLLAIIGVVMIFSATHGDTAAFYKKQMLWICFGTVGLVAAAWLDYHLYARFARQMYVVNLLLLLVVLKFAHNVNGAGRWIRIAGFPFQPSESAKLIVILTLGAFLARRHETIQEVKTLLLSLGYVLVPALLILKQPDLGTALVLMAIWFGMVFMAGAKVKHLAILVFGSLLIFMALWQSGKVIKEYQKARIITLINPESDTSKAGWHVKQARIAIGAGGVWGKGLLHGMAAQGHWVPEKQTDFIFTDIGEELGFVGTVTLTALYGLLLVRGYSIIATADEDIYGKLIATGIVAMLAFHVIVNIGMNIGILPVAGIPLPLISAGGSNMLMTLTCIGLLQSVSVHRHELMF